MKQFLGCSYIVGFLCVQRSSPNGRRGRPSPSLSGTRQSPSSAGPGAGQGAGPDAPPTLGVCERCAALGVRVPAPPASAYGYGAEWEQSPLNSSLCPHHAALLHDWLTTHLARPAGPLLITGESVARSALIDERCSVHSGNHERLRLRLLAVVTHCRSFSRSVPRKAPSF